MGVKRQPAYNKLPATYKKDLADHLYEILSLIQEVVHSLTKPAVGTSTGMTLNWLKGARWLLLLLTPPAQHGQTGPNQLHVNPRNGRIGAAPGSNVNIWQKDFEFANGKSAGQQQKQLSFAGSVYQ